MTYFKHRFFVLLLGVILFQVASGQAPVEINYQAIARNTQSGEALANQQVFAILSIRSGGATGPVVYEESHPGITTNTFGLINLRIGGGDIVQGNISAINWGAGTYWLEVEIDAGSGLQSLGAMQFVSVPYAFHANTVTNADDADANPANELIESGFFDPESNSIVLNEGGANTITISLDELNVEDGDTSSENELITSAEFNPETEQITIQEGSNIQVIDLSGFSVEDADSDPTNEKIDSNNGLQLIGTNLVITEGGQSYSVNLGSLEEDDDPNPNNELINALELLNDSILVITEAGIEHEVNLSALGADEDWIVTDNGEQVYNTGKKVGIGNSNPQAVLDIDGGELNVPQLRIRNQNTPVVYSAEGKVGFGTESPQSSLEIAGSIGYGYTLLENDGSGIHVVDESDNIIVCKIMSGGSVLPIFIEMPDPATCPGRVITIRKTGDALFLTTVLILFNGAQVDFSSQDIDLDENQRETRQFMSLGVDGWTELFRE